MVCPAAKQPIFKALAVLLACLVCATSLSAAPATFVVTTAAGLIPGASSIAIQQHLVQPVVVAYDPYGSLYYATYHQVWRLNPDGTTTLIAGNGTSDPTHLGDDGPATAASLCWIGGLAIDAQLNIYISDFGPFEIRKVAPAGNITRFAGTDALPSYGTPSNAGAGVVALRVPLNPGALVLDSSNLYVSDYSTGSVLAFTLDGSSSKVIAGNHGNQSAGDGGLAINASLFNPGALALVNGVLYINEAGGARIRQVSFRSGIISTLVQLAQTALADNGNEGLAADSDGSLYVQHGNTIDRIYPNTTTPQPYAGGGNSNPGDPGPALQVTLLTPKSLAVNPVSHDLALADYNSNLVETITFATGAIQTVAGMAHFAGDRGPAALAVFNGLESMAADSQGNLYLSDVGNNRIRRIDSTGIITTVAGSGVLGFSGDGGPATAAALNLKHGPAFTNNLAVDSSGNVYFSDYGNGRIRKIDSNGVITTVAGGGAAQLAPGFNALSVALQPGPLAVDSSGNIYFGQVVMSLFGNIPTIYKIDSTGKLSAFAGGAASNGLDSGPALSTPIGNAVCLVADSLDNLYVCDSLDNRVREVSNGIMTTIAGAAAAMGSPSAVTLDPSGDIFIYAAGQVLEINSAGATTPLTTFSNITSIVGGMAADLSGNLYLSEGGVYLQEGLAVGPNGAPPVISSNGVVGAGGSVPPVQSVSPGAMVSIFGSNFSPAGTQRMLEATDILSGHLPTNLGGICVTFGGVSASIAGVFPNQLNVLVPNLPPGAATVQVTSNCGGSHSVTGNRSGVAVNPVSPEFFTDVTSGNVIPATGINGPIVAGGIVEAYGTGWGTTNPAVSPGTVPGGAAQLAEPLSLTVGGEAIPPANILYAGLSPCCAGIYQIDFTLPTDVPAGNLPLILTVNGISSPNNAYLVVEGP